MSKKSVKMPMDFKQMLYIAKDNLGAYKILLRTERDPAMIKHYHEKIAFYEGYISGLEFSKSLVHQMAKDSRDVRYLDHAYFGAMSDNDA